MKLRLLITTGLVSIAGCGPMPAPIEHIFQDAGTQPAAATTSPAKYKIDAPIARRDIATQLALSGAPRYLAKFDMLFFDVEVTNNGQVPLISAGKMPVQLAINLAGADGIVDESLGEQLVGRAMLPLIVEGTKGLVNARIRAEKILAQTIRVELFQEGIGWFGRGYNQPTLDIGAFQRCNGVPKTLCDSSGVPLAIQ